METGLSSGQKVQEMTLCEMKSLRRKYNEWHGEQLV
jgi:hypothetical protein